MKRIITILVLTIVGIGAVIVWYAPSQVVTASSSTLTFSGVLEGEQIAIVPEIGGRVADLRVKEGDVVNAGDVLVQLDTALIDAQLLQAQAAVAAANADLAQALAGARQEEIAAAQGAVEQTMGARDGAQQTIRDMRALRTNPQTLNAQITEARGRSALAEAQIGQAQANADLARVERDRYGEASVEYRTADGEYRAALAELDAANAARNGAENTLKKLLGMKARPIQLNAQVNAAQAQLAQAEAQLAQAQAALDAFKAGASAEQIAMVRAGVKQAEAALALLQIQRSKLSLRAPIGGVITKRAVNLGETASVGAPLLTLANLDTVKLTVYLPASQLARVALEQRVRVRLDAYPDRSFEGRVVFVSPRAEFTPRNVQTSEERAATVFTVKIALENRDRALTMGMTGEVLFGD